MSIIVKQKYLYLGQKKEFCQNLFFAKTYLYQTIH